MTATNERIMRDYYAAWIANDAEAATAFWDDDIVHHVPGRSRLSGDYHGKQQFLDAYGRVFAELGGTIEVVGVHEYFVKGDHAVGLVREQAIRGPNSLQFDRVVVYHLRDGKIVETWSHDYDPYTLDEFWS
jgi:ketosteroid isomerase-like protein